VDKPQKSVTHGQCDAGPTVTFPGVWHHRPLTGTNLYCLVTDIQRAEIARNSPRMATICLTNLIDQFYCKTGRNCI